MYWYNDEVQTLAAKAIPEKGTKQRLLFYGSSSIRLWPDVMTDFPQFEVINRAFGGSTLAACCWFFEQLVSETDPDAVIFYAGDNDLGDGRHPEEVFLFFKVLMDKISKHFGDIPVAFVSVKPSFARHGIIKSIRYTNEIISKEIDSNYPNCTFVNVFDQMNTINRQNWSLFDADGLHMTEDGYELWKRCLYNQFLTPKFLNPNR